MDLAAQLAEVDRLRALEFPARRVTSAAVESGPGYHVADLAVSEDFHDADVVRREAVAEDFEAACQALIELLAQRWGEPQPLDLYPYLIRLEEGGQVPPPLDLICGYVSEVYGWTVGDRWMALGIGQGDRELPFQLVLAVGEAGALPSSGGEGRLA
ncbi:hypothetical protein [Actinacidiphila acidipaludis]|uniref:Uncharacterized protein n=1 Tax=Actinacidiphila acidipaludis TaxID=2873382 RepID=A0ABS7Q789_9ACTN|nr:hypothetical protein [Streptomyces acidipaludis]MBY8878310.1 hypothetical protein [Streptomyces acidipaludis]